MSDTFEFEDQSHAERLIGTLHDPTATAGQVLAVAADGSISAAAASAGFAPETILGALSTVADAPAKAVLASIIDALVDLGLAVDGTT
jgi:hypothetical protein